MSTILNRRKIYSAGYSDVATIAESIVNNTWTWPTEWSLLHTIHVPISNVGAKDEPFWPTNDGKEGAFASSHVWKDFRMLNNTVQWGNASGGIGVCCCIVDANKGKIDRTRYVGQMVYWEDFELLFI